MKKILTTFILLLCTSAYASEFTINYRLEIPAVGDRNWQSIISRDIISIDSAIQILSQDSAWEDAGTSVYLRTLTDNVGIGTASPAAALDVVGTSPKIRVGGSTNPYISLEDTTNTNKVKVQALDSLGYIGSETNFPIALITNNSPYVYLTVAGDVGIKTASPIVSLDVAGLISADAYLLDASLAASPDVVTNLGGALYVDKTTGRLRYYNPKDGWKTVTLE